MELLERVDGLIDRRHLLGHRFYQQWAEGTLPLDALREYARQYYAFESTFPRFLSALHSRCDEPRARSGLLDNLWDEEHGETSHRELWLRFAEGLGVPREDVAGANWNPATKALLDCYWRTSREGPVAAGVAAVYAYERQVPAVSRAKIDGLREHYGIADLRTLAFFEVHGELDEEHSAAERRIVADLGTRRDEAAVVEAAGAALDAWWSFLDAVTPAA